MIDNPPPPMAVPAPVRQWLSPPPSNITDSVMTLRAACAKWTPHPGLTASEYQPSRQTCDVVLDRDVQLASGIAFGVGCTLLAIGVIAACRILIRARVINRFEDLATYGFVIFIGYVMGSASGGLIALQLGSYWYALQIPFVSTGCVITAIGVLAGLRWRTQTVDRVMA